MNNPSFHEELAAHLEGQKQPMPHPQRYDMGESHRRQLDAQRLRDMGLRHLTHDEQADIRLRDMGLQHPGPITMHEACCDEETEMLAGEDRSMEMLALCLVLILIGVIVGMSLLVWGVK